MGMLAENPRFLLQKAILTLMKVGEPVQVSNKKSKLLNKTENINLRQMVEEGKLTMKEAPLKRQSIGTEYLIKLSTL